MCIVLMFSVLFYYFSFSHGDKEPGDDIIFAHDKGIMPSFQKFFTSQGKEAERVLGQGFVPIPSQTTDLFTSQMMAALPTKQAPELFTWWSAFRVKPLVDQNLVDDLTDLWDKHRDEYDQGIRDAYTFDGKVYGFPYSIEYWAVWYNKSVFKKFGLKEPQTWKEFMDICATLKACGISPILSSLQDQWYAFVWFMAMIIGQDPDLYVDLCEGRASYLDPRVKKAMTVWARMIKKGYFTDPATNMFTNGGYLWNTEKFGMILCGSWYYSTVLVPQGVKEENIGVFILPSHNEKAGKNIAMETGPVLTGKNAPQNKAARKIADWWMGSQGNAHFSNLLKSYSPNHNSDQSYLPVAKQKLLTQIYNGDYRILNRFWEATPTPICEFAVRKLGEFIMEPDTIDLVLSDLDKAAKKYFTESPYTQH